MWFSDLEATLHLDHLFGEGSKSADDPINQMAFGFARLESSLVELGHAGEGHCFEANSGQTS